MKLHIRLRRRIWRCCFEDERGMPIMPWGHGYTPSDALKEWQAFREAQT